MKLIITRKVLHLASFWKWEFLDVTVFDAILTSRQAREKLQWLYENLCRIISLERLFWKKYDL